VVHYQIKDQPEGTLLYGFFIRPYRDLLRANDLIELMRARAVQPPVEDQMKTKQPTAFQFRQKDGIRKGNEWATNGQQKQASGLCLGYERAKATISVIM
jgi:hypothetical protein